MQSHLSLAQQLVHKHTWTASQSDSVLRGISLREKEMVDALSWFPKWTVKVTWQKLSSVEVSNKDHDIKMGPSSQFLHAHLVSNTCVLVEMRWSSISFPMMYLSKRSGKGFSGLCQDSSNPAPSRKFVHYATVPGDTDSSRFNCCKKVNQLGEWCILLSET